MDSTTAWALSGAEWAYDQDREEEEEARIDARVSTEEQKRG